MPTTRVIDGFAISVEKNPVPQTPEEVFTTIKTFGKQWTPHMFMVDWEAGKGWHDARIVPYQNLSIPPTAPCLHYGQEGFEGMKATRTRDGRIALFDPKANAERFMKTAKEVDMEPVPVDLFIAGLKALLLQERDYIPNDGNLYIRPTEVGMSPFWGAEDTNHCLFYIIVTPAANSSPEPFDALVESIHSRAGPGGTGSAKVGGNYSRLTADKKRAREQFGCADVLYTAADNKELIEEFTVRNFFVEFTEGVVLTPELRDRILPGTTRNKILQLVREKDEKGEKAYEGSYTIEKLRQDLAKGVVKSVFSCGTSVGVQPIGNLVLNTGERIPMPEGTLPKKLFDYFNGLRDGTVEDTHGWMVFLD
ncbi:aminotransferase [Mycena albidolilacea]|uniref:Aminotransferase n=1 Tax=Mycena albidolilacea TaxID=1033008 RepID=A0AAD7E7X2_9AGAR|nr:aminotransferase [Mycena albidolilacea]